MKICRAGMVGKPHLVGLEVVNVIPMKYFLILLLTFGLVACEPAESDAEQAAEEVQQGAEEAGEAVQDTAEDAGDAVEDATEGD